MYVKSTESYLILPLGWILVRPTSWMDLSASDSMSSVLSRRAAGEVEGLQISQDTGHRTQDTGHMTQDTGHRTQNTGHMTQDTGCMTQDT